MSIDFTKKLTKKWAKRAIFLGVDSIFNFENLSGTELCQLFRAFFTQIHVQSQIVTDRRVVFHTLENLLKNKGKLENLKTLGSEFTLAFIQAVDAEKDPLNMKVIFSLWPIILEVRIFLSNQVNKVYNFTKFFRILH